MMQVTKITIAGLLLFAYVGIVESFRSITHDENYQYLCPGHSWGPVPHPNDCRRYIVCPEVSGDRFSLVVKCSEVFNPHTNRCDLAQNMISRCVKTRDGRRIWIDYSQRYPWGPIR